MILGIVQAQDKLLGHRSEQSNVAHLCSAPYPQSFAQTNKFLVEHPHGITMQQWAREHHGRVIGARGGDASQVTLWEHKIPVSGAENVINLRPCLRLTGADPSKPSTVWSSETSIALRTAQKLLSSSC